MGASSKRPAYQFNGMKQAGFTTKFLTCSCWVSTAGAQDHEEEKNSIHHGWGRMRQTCAKVYKKFHANVNATSGGGS
jgi:hypothetical protein